MPPKEKDVKAKAQKPDIEDRARAATIAVGHLINPDEDRLVEVSYLPIGIVHSLTMIQAYEEQLDTLIAQIRKVQEWYITRSIRRKITTLIADATKKLRAEKYELKQGLSMEVNVAMITKAKIRIESIDKEMAEKEKAIRNEWSQAVIADAVEREMATVISLDSLDSKELFIHRFRHAFYQTSRGKDGKFVESLTMLADTDLQTRSPDLEDAFRAPTRNQ